MRGINPRFMACTEGRFTLVGYLVGWVPIDVPFSMAFVFGITRLFEVCLIAHTGPVRRDQGSSKKVAEG